MRTSKTKKKHTRKPDVRWELKDGKPTRVISERQLQKECVEWFRLQYPDGLIFAIPNGGSRHPAEAKALKAQGVVAGVPDLFIGMPGIGRHGVWVELKVGKNKLTESQEAIFSILGAMGEDCVVCRSLQEFQEVANDCTKPLFFVVPLEDCV